MAVGVEKLSGAGLLTGNARKAEGGHWVRDGRYGAVAPLDGRVGTEIMPGVFAQIGMQYGARARGADFELFARISEKNHAHSTLNPMAAYQKRFTLDEIMNDVMIAYPNTRPMCSANCDGAAAAVLVSETKLRTLSLEQQRRAVKISASVLTSDPWTGGLPGAARHQHPDPQRRGDGLRAGRRSAPPTSTWSSCTTASPPRSSCTTTTSACASPAAPPTSSTPAPPWRDGSTPVNVSGGLQSKGHPVSATGIANVWEVATHLRGEAGDRQIEGARVGLAHVIGLGSACGVHVLEKAAA